MKMAHVADYKKEIVKKFERLIEEYPVVGAINMENLPTPQLQKMREQLRSKVVILMGKRRLIKIAIENSKEKKKGIEKLEEYLVGMPALLFSKENPFTLAKIIQKNKSSAPAKAGQTAPKDIEVKAGPTSFSPGPIISELGSIGLKTVIENGKIAIKEDTVVVKKGETIDAKTASILTRLGIEPMEIGLDLVAVYEDGEIIVKDVLMIDEKEYLNKIYTAANDAYRLSIGIAYPTKDNIEQLIKNAFIDAKTIALEQNIISDAVINELLAKASAQGNAVKEAAKYEPEATQPVEEKKEEPKAEEKNSEEAPQAEKEKTEDTKEKVKEEQKAEEKKEEAKKEEPKKEVQKEEVQQDKKEKAEVPEPEEKEKEEKPAEEKKQETEEKDNAPKAEEAKKGIKEEQKVEVKEKEEKPPGRIKEMDKKAVEQRVEEIMKAAGRKS
ncbi:50S ribosomal protein L10 [Candidatus Woesearchaeota archaeon]|nr:MAG: 50S ribosomal protein L10 [Candidatus Woesearchaeota archaeon]